MRSLFLPLLLLCASCAALDKMIPVTDPETGVVTEARVGDVVADAVDAYTQPAANIISTAIPNPIVGAGIAAALLAAAGAATSRLRKKRTTEA